MQKRGKICRYIKEGLSNGQFSFSGSDDINVSIIRDVVSFKIHSNVTINNSGVSISGTYSNGWGFSASISPHKITARQWPFPEISVNF
jgi:hypothetical protein